MATTNNNIQPIDSNLTGTDLIAAINDRLRRVASSTGVAGPAGRDGSPGAAGASGSVTSVNLGLRRVGTVRTLNETLIDILKESTSVRNFGVVGDGVTDDSAALQEAIDTIVLNGGWLRIPAGFNVFIGSATMTVRSGLRLIGDGASFSLITGDGHQPTGFGMLDLDGISDVDIIDIGFEQNTLTPVGIPYVSAGDPSDAQWTNGTTVWIKTGCSRITLIDCGWSHPNGYCGYWYGNVTDLTILRPVVRNSRPAVLGVGSDLNHFGWNGGFFGANKGGWTTVLGALVPPNFFTNVHVLDATFQNITGHAFWTRSSVLPDPPFMNRNVSFTATMEDVLGDGAEPGDIDTYYEKITSRRGGFICTNGATTGFTTPGVLVDTSATAVRVPKWLNVYDPALPGPAGVPNRNITPVVMDTTGILLNAYREFDADGFNGALGSGDGMGNSKWTGVGTSCFYSTDPLINLSLCGDPGSSPPFLNYTSGLITSNSNHLSAVGQGITIDGCQINGCGYISIGGYAMRYSSILACTVRQPIVAGQSSPIVLGSIGPLMQDRSYGVKVSSCHIEWAAPGGSAIVEDAQYGPFASGDTNWIDSNNTFTCGALFFKNPATDTTTGPTVFASVTPVAQTFVGSFIQSEGVLTSHADHALKAYRVDGKPLFSSTLLTMYLPAVNIYGNGGLTIAPPGWSAGLHAAGSSIIDPGGNLQTTIAGGFSGPIPGPLIWNATLFGTTSDGTITWICQGPYNGLVLDASYLGSNARLRSVALPGGLLLIDNVGNFQGNSLKLYNAVAGGAPQNLVIDNAANSFFRSVAVGITTPNDLISNVAMGTHVQDAQPIHTSEGHGITWQGSAGGYIAGFENTDPVPNANGLLVKVRDNTAATRAFTINVNGSDLFAVNGQGFATAQAFSIGATGVITATRDSYLNSVSVGTAAVAATAAGLAIAGDRTGFFSQIYVGTHTSPTETATLVVNSLGQYVGPISINPQLVLGSNAYTGGVGKLQPFQAIAHGSFDGLLDQSAVVGLVGPAVTTTQAIANYFYPAGPLFVRDAGGSFGLITPSVVSGIEANALNAMVVAMAPATPSYAGSVALSGFAVAGVTGAAIWGLNLLVRDYTFDLQTNRVAASVNGIECDVNIAHVGTSFAGVNVNVAWGTPANFGHAFQQPGSTGWDTIKLQWIMPNSPYTNVPGYASAGINIAPTGSGITLNPGYYDYGINLNDFASLCGLKLGLVPAVKGTGSQFLDFTSTSSSGNPHIARIFSTGPGANEGALFVSADTFNNPGGVYFTKEGWIKVLGTAGNPSISCVAGYMQSFEGFFSNSSAGTALNLPNGGVFAQTAIFNSVAGNAISVPVGGIAALTASFSSTAFNAVEITGGAKIGTCVYVANTTAPPGLDLASKVEIHGNGAFGSGGRAYYTAIDSTGAVTGYFGVTSVDSFMGTFTAHQFAVRTNNTPRIIVSSTGSVQIPFGISQCAGISCDGINPTGGHIGQGINGNEMQLFFPGGFTLAWTAGSPPFGQPAAGTYRTLRIVGGVLTSVLP